jgi:hypothetical protein
MRERDVAKRRLVGVFPYRRFHATRYCEPENLRRDEMDAIYLLLLAALYAVTHALVWALNRLGKTS